MGRLLKAALILLPGALAACGDSTLELPETATLAFVAPTDGASLGSPDDVDLALAGLQVDISLLVTNNLEGGIASLAIEGATSTAATLPLNGDELLAETVFPSFTLPEGELTLNATIEVDGEIRASASINVTVSLTGPDGTPTITITTPEDGSTLTSEDDLDPALAGTQVAIEATASDIEEGTTLRLRINNANSGSAATESGRVLFPSVTLPQGEVTIELIADVSGTEFSDEITVTVADNGCGVAVNPLPADGCGFTLATDDEDPATEGVQTSFTVTTDCATAELFVDGASVATGAVVDGTVILSNITVPEREFSVRAEAADGERTGASQTLVFGADFTGSVITIAGAPDDGVLTEDQDEDSATDGIQFSLAGTVSEDTASLAVTVDGDDVDATLDGTDWTATTITVADGESVSVTIAATDDCGNPSSREIEFSSIPTCVVAFDQTANLAGCDYTLQTTDEDAGTDGLQTTFSLTTTCNTVEVFVDGESVGNATVVDAAASLAGVTIPDGAFLLSATGSAEGGSTASAELALESDLVAPEVAIDDVSGDVSGDGRLTTNDDTDSGTAGVQFAAGGMLADAETLRVTLGSDEVVSSIDVGTWSTGTLTISDAEVTTLEATVVDACGNTASASVELTGDTRGPTISGFDVVSDANDDDVVIESEATDVTGGVATVAFSVSVSEAGEPASLTLLSDVPAVGTVVAQLDAPGSSPILFDGGLVEGSHNLTLVAVDSDGNTTSQSVGSLTIDFAPVPPTVSVTGNRRNGNFDISWLASSDASSYEFRLSSEPIDDWDALDGDAGNMVFSDPTPGETITVTLPELRPRQTQWYFAVRITDPQGQTADGLADAFVGLMTHEEASGFLSTTTAEGVGDLNSDGFDDFIVAGSSSDDPAVESAYGVLVVYGGPDATALSSTLLAPQTGDVQFGYAANGIGDVNGDGAADIYVAMGNVLTLGPARGGYIYFGTTTAGGEISTTPAVTIVAPGLVVAPNAVLSLGTYDMHGWGNVVEFDALTATTGDFDDIVIGAGGADNAGIGTNGNDNDGVIFVIAGRDSASWPSEIELSTDSSANAAIGVATINASTQNQRLGRQTAIVSDSNGDGFAEIVAFSAAGNGGSPNALAGRLLQFRGGEASSFATSAGDAVVATPSVAISNTSIFSLNGADGGADVNGDGMSDVVAIDTGSSTVSARCELLLGALPFNTTLVTFDIGTPDIRPGRVSLLGDLDVNIDDELSDGRFSDLVLRVRDRSDLAAPLNIVLYENLGESPWFSEAESTVIYAPDTNTRSASEISSAGDIDGDGFSDIVLTALPGRILLHY
jgi:hypothetical protein